MEEEQLQDMKEADTEVKSGTSKKKKGRAVQRGQYPLLPPLRGGGGRFFQNIFQTTANALTTCSNTYKSTVYTYLSSVLAERWDIPSFRHFYSDNNAGKYIEYAL